MTLIVYVLPYKKVKKYIKVENIEILHEKRTNFKTNFCLFKADNPWDCPEDSETSASIYYYYSSSLRKGVVRAKRSEMTKSNLKP